jgi:formate-dependent nitrite reductase cytochrome c552 subunit
MPRRLGRLLMYVGCLCALSCSLADEPARLHTAHPPPVPSGSVTIDARQPLLPTFPCSRCHAPGKANTQERKLTEFHTQKVLDHGTQSGWCYRCHGKDDVDKLRLADGTLVGFNEAYELCGSCHGDKLRDWKANLHGLTTGYWLGERQRRSCPACHDPHSPRFPQMTAEHAPALPRTVPATSHGGAP